MAINLKRVYGYNKLAVRWLIQTLLSLYIVFGFVLFLFLFFLNQIEPKNAWLIVNTIHNHDLLSKLRIK